MIRLPDLFAASPAWSLLPPLALGALAVYLLLPRPRGFPRLWGSAAAGAALILAGGLLVRVQAVNLETVLFFTFAGIAVVAGGLLITQSNPTRAALSFALVILSSCGLFLLLAAPFVMAATIIIYAGAIIVTFLFVIMLAQQEGRSDADLRSREPALSCVAGFVLLGALLSLLQRNYDTRELEALLQRAARAAEQTTPDGIASALGDDEAFFAALQEQLKSARALPEWERLEGTLTNLRSEWGPWKKESNGDAMRKGLRDLMAEAGVVLHGAGKPAAGAGPSPFSVPPAHSRETVAPLGRALFTDFLLAVELGGILLLVATVGAIAIAGRRREQTR